MAKGNSEYNEPALKKARTSLHPCGTCAGECYIDVILCDICDTWFHTSCQGLGDNELMVLKDLPKGFLCSGCRSTSDGNFDFSTALLRLHLASKGEWRDFHNTVKLEEVLVASHGTPLPDCPIEPITVELPGLEIDDQSQELLARNGGLQGYRPVWIEGDGDALFRSVSIAMYGTDALTQELRVRCCLEMVMNETFYQVWHKDDDLYTISPNYKQSCRDSATPQGASSAWTLHTVASVIHSPILSVYPTVNGLMDKCVSILNNKFVPRLSSDRSSVSIMWTRFGDVEHPDGCWIPNHFVPLVPVSANIKEPVLRPLLCGNSTSIDVTPSEHNADESTTDIEHEQDQCEQENDMVHEEFNITDVSPADDDDVPIIHSFIKREVSSPPRVQSPVRRRRHNVMANTPTSPRPKNVNRPDEAEGGAILRNGFLPTDELLKVLNTEEDGLDYIPPGLKENVYFVIDNIKNLHRRSLGQRSIFSDDCGSYDTKSSSTKTTVFYYEGPERMVYIIKQDGLYGRTMKKKFAPLDPQPEPNQVVIMKRYYGVLKRSPLYRKRVTWFDGLPLQDFHAQCMEKAVVEYCGPYPDEISIHGNSKKNYKVYTQSPLVSMDDSTEQIVATMKPKEAFARLVAEGKAPRDIRQVQNKRYNIMKKAKQMAKTMVPPKPAEIEMEEEPSASAFTNIVIDTSQELELANTGQLVVEAVQNEGEAATYYIIHTDNSHIDGHVPDIDPSLAEQIEAHVAAQESLVDNQVDPQIIDVNNTSQ